MFCLIPTSSSYQWTHIDSHSIKFHQFHQTVFFASLRDYWNYLRPLFCLVRVILLRNVVVTSNFPSSTKKKKRKTLNIGSHFFQPTFSVLYEKLDFRGKSWARRSFTDSYLTSSLKCAIKSEKFLVSTQLLTRNQAAVKKYYSNSIECVRRKYGKFCRVKIKFWKKML